MQEVTRIAKSGNRVTQSTIDVVMTNTYSNFFNCQVLDDRIGDHIKTASTFKKVLIRDHCKTNVSNLKHFLSDNSDYEPIMNCNNVNEATDGLNSHVQNYYNHFCPIKQIKCHSHYIHKPSKILDLGEKYIVYSKEIKQKSTEI